MNEFEELLNSVSEVSTGDVVTAEVISVDNDQANVVIEGTGIEGVLTRRELTNDRDANVADLVKDGETLEVLVLRQVVGKDTDTVTYLVSKKRLEARKAWDKLVGREEEVVTVKGTRAVKGGLSVEFEGLRGFIPASMIDTRFVRNTEQFVGQEFDAKIKEVDPAENRFILSRREVVEAYIKRLNDLENIAMSYPGVTKTYAIQAGRELRVIVGADKIDDKQTENLSNEIAKRIQDEMTYPGQVKITVIRETRSVSYAK